MAGTHLHGVVDAVVIGQVHEKAVVGLLVGDMVKGGVHRANLRIGEQHHRLIQQVDAPVVHHTAALLGVLPPVAGDAVGAVDTAFNTVEVAQDALSENLLHNDVAAIPAAVLVDGEQLARLVRRLQHLGEQAAVEGNGLLADDVLARLQSLDGDGVMHVVGGGDEHDLDAVVRQQILQTRVHVQTQFGGALTPTFPNVPHTGADDFLLF